MELSKVLTAAVLVAAFVSTACESSTEDDAEPQPFDNRVELPAEDPDHVIFLGQEVIIEPGEDKMYCFHMEAEEDMALIDIEMMQGEYGHHSVIVSSTDPLPAGTIEDCSDNEASSKFSAFLIPVPNPPQGAAFYVEKGTPIVLQSHYVNASDERMLVRDAVRARRISPDEVQLWLSTFTATTFEFEIPGDGEIHEKVFDCVMDRDVTLIELGGHLHEHGSSFEIDIGPDEDSLERIYTIDSWIPEFRDVPPLELYSGSPLPLPEGTILRTTCRWQNNTGEMLHFPAEMCVAFGVLGGTQERYDCRK